MLFCWACHYVFFWVMNSDKQTCINKIMAIDCSIHSYIYCLLAWYLRYHAICFSSYVVGTLLYFSFDGCYVAQLLQLILVPHAVALVLHAVVLVPLTETTVLLHLVVRRTLCVIIYRRERYSNMPCWLAFFWIWNKESHNSEIKWHFKLSCNGLC